jgi:hypothetical protein
MHFDLIPAWSYGTVASPGAFIKFVVHCAGLTVKLQASDTPIAGDRHECGTGRITSTENLFTSAPPAGNPLSPNPLVGAPDHSGVGRYIKPSVGTPIPGVVHQGGMSMNDNMPMPANDQLAGAQPVTFDLGAARSGLR